MRPKNSAFFYNESAVNHPQHGVNHTWIFLCVNYAFRAIEGVVRLRNTGARVGVRIYSAAGATAKVTHQRVSDRRVGTEEKRFRPRWSRGSQLWPQ